jgi:hypothetical protein
LENAQHDVFETVQITNGGDRAISSEPDATHAYSALDAHQRRSIRLGVAGAVLAFVVLALLQTWTVPLFSPQDEPSHYGYAIEVSRGRLPAIETPIPADGIAVLERRLARRDPVRRTIWTANHPPLFYAIMAVPVRVGVATGHPLGGLRVARALSVLLSAAAVVLIAALARLLMPNNPQASVAAAGLAALLPSFVNTSAVLSNDSLAVLTSTALLTLALAWLVRGSSRGGVALIAGTAAAASLTRASGLIVVGIAGLAMLAGCWLSSRDPLGDPGGQLPAGIAPGPRRARAIHRARRTWQARLGPAALVGLTVLATSGWFWASNVLLYGDLTGQDALLQRFQRVGSGSAVGMLGQPGYWQLQQQRLWDPTYMQLARTKWLWLLSVPSASGLLVAAARRVRAGQGFASLRLDGPRLRLALAWVLGIGLFVLLEVSTAAFVADGGGLHARYLFPALGLMAIAAAVGLATLPGGRRGLPVVAMLTGMVAANVWTWSLVLRVRIQPAPGTSAIWTALNQADVPTPGFVLILAGLLLAVGIGAQALALWRLGEPHRAISVPSVAQPPVEPMFGLSLRHHAVAWRRSAPVRRRAQGAAARHR